MRTHKDLWVKIKSELLRNNSGVWSARLAQQAVQEYKRRGGGYHGRKDKNNSLVRWTAQRWDYAGKEGSSRYLPQVIRNNVSHNVLQKENRRKGTQLGRFIPYTTELREEMKKNKIY